MGIIAGILLFALGISFIGMYVLEAVIRRAGDPDQSLIFWYLPILFIGIAGAISGLFLTLLGIQTIKSPAGKNTEARR